MIDQVMHELMSHGTAILEQWLPNSSKVGSLLAEEVLHYSRQFTINRGEATGLFAAETAILAQVYIFIFKPSPA